MSLLLLDGTDFLSFVTQGISTVVGWCGTVITSIFGANGDLAMLAPLVAIGISISAILLGKFMLRINFVNSVELSL